MNNVTDNSVEVWDTWIVAGDFWADIELTMYVAVVSGDEAPDIVPDANGDGDVDQFDLKALGLASPVVTRTFCVNQN